MQLQPLLWLNPFIEDYNVLIQIKIQSRSRTVKQNKFIVKKNPTDSLKSNKNKVPYLSHFMSCTCQETTQHSVQCKSALNVIHSHIVKPSCYMQDIVVEIHQALQMLLNNSTFIIYVQFVSSVLVILLSTKEI